MLHDLLFFLQECGAACQSCSKKTKWLLFALYLSFIDLITDTAHIMCVV